MEREIARLNTLAALGEMAATVAHQVRNPLSGILGYSSLLKRDLDSNDPRQKLISKITEGVETLNGTITTLLDYTRDEELRCERVLFDDFVRDSLRQVRRENVEMTRGMEFKLLPPDAPGNDPVELMIDPVLFRQVLFNLLANSCEACRREGAISMQWSKLPRRKAAEKYGDTLLIELNETVFELRVRDSGPGVSDQAEESLFSPFFTTKEGGNGLGLAVANKIMKAHCGDITFENAPDGGAEFVLLLPTRIGRFDNQ